MFIHKHSKNLIIELTNYIITNFAFGDFVFRDTDTQAEVARAADLPALQQHILHVPDKVLEYHTRKNDISKWLNARAMFTVAQSLKYVRNEDFRNVDEIRNYIYESITSYRIGKGRSVIATFDKQKFNEYLIFSRI